MARLNNNRGILLISTFMVAGVFFVLSGAYMTSAIVQSNAVQRQKDSMQALYAAEKGVEYIFSESQNHGWNFTTHEVAATDLDGDTKINDLAAKSSAPIVTLSGASINFATGCYEIDTPWGNTVEIKTYEDPAKPGEIIALSRSQTSSFSRIIKVRISRRSLYKYFMFFPESQDFSGNFDGKNAGGVHVNGDIVLESWANLANLNELSASGYVYYDSGSYYPPYYADDWDGLRDGKAPMPQQDYPPYHYYMSCSIIHNKDHRFDSGAEINGIEIPAELSTEWQWDKYWGDDAASNPDGSPEFPVTFVVPQEELDRVGAANTNQYWDIEYGDDIAELNPEWWQDKVYGNDRASGIETMPVRYTNSEYQPEDWKQFIENSGLVNTVKERNTGGQYLAPLNIESNYSDYAKNNGLYLGLDTDNSLEIYLNGAKVSSLPCWIEDNVRFFNAVRPHLDDDDNPVMENVLQFDVARLINSCLNEKPQNNIIYIAHKNLRLVNATKLPPGGLTVVSPYNVYIKGNYNTDESWQPSAVITNSLVYTLSEDFNDPQTIPMIYEYEEDPYSLEYQDFLDKYASGARYPADLPVYPAGGLTPEWVKANLTGDQQLTLLQSGENYYELDNEPYMANRATKDTTYKVAIVSPEDPYPYELERWESVRTVEGAFLLLERSWSDIEDVQSTYSGRMAWKPDSQYNYETQFTTSSGRPAGDFFAGSSSWWEQVSDFNHHI